MATVTDIRRPDPTVVEFDVRTDEMLVNMGPQHPSTHGVLRLALRTDGEVISDVQPHMGYLHRCAEKIGENVTPIQFIPYTDRMDYLAAMNMNLGYSLAVEKLCGMKLPEKANVIRVIIAELNRIASHLVAMGTYGLDLGTFSPFLYAFREREQILDLLEEVCGARLTYSYITIGGVHDDLPPGWVEHCKTFIEYLKPRIEEYHILLTRNHIFVKRTAGIGLLSKDMALSYGCTGPMLRGSLNRAAGDPEWDLRRLEPYCGYENYDFNVVIPPFPERPATSVIGDAWHRYYVRMIEVVESIKIVEQGLQKYATAQGSHRIEPPRHLPAGECYVESECPRGQMGFHVVGAPQKVNVPLRVRAKSSCFANLSVTNEICRGCLIADVPAIVGSIDIVMGEIDR
ncbi:MAG TPA: NADH-quinone oxidoreductase subunit D [Gemmataceae bacterium]|jgi:NADH-quinone oxidoreductase subunit D|nr:NADH-quinone oxidoreductase subunit D [Gemmataceae bacterium]